MLYKKHTLTVCVRKTHCVTFIYCDVFPSCKHVSLRHRDPWRLQGCWERRTSGLPSRLVKVSQTREHTITHTHTHPRVPLPRAVLYWGKVGGWIQVTRQPGGWGAAEQLPPRYQCLCWALKRSLNQASQAGFICSPPAFNYLATHYICFRGQTKAHHPEYTHMEMLVYSRSSISSA